MYHSLFRLILLMMLFLVLEVGLASAQQVPEDRIQRIENRLKSLAVMVPGLNQKVKLSMSGASASEFLRALASANNLNINIDPKLDFKINSNFSNETALNVLLFLAEQYQLDINLIGSIMSISRLPQAVAPVVKKEPKVSYLSDGEMLSLELNSDTLVLVAKLISQLSGKNVIVPVGLLQKTVTAFITAPFGSALDKLAYANGLKVQQTNDGVFIFQPLAEDEELYINADNATAVKKGSKPVAGMAGQAGSASIASKKDGSGVRQISVDAVNSPILELIKSTSSEAGVNYFIYSEIKGSVTTRLSNISYDNFLMALLQGTEYTFKREGGIYMIGERKLEGLRSHRIVHLQHRSIDTVQMMIPTDWKRGVEIKEFREQNTLLLSGSAPQLNEIENYIKQIDRIVPMVLIEVTLVDIRKGRTVKTGISARVGDSIKTGGSIWPGLDYTFGANSINNFLSKLGSNNSINLGKVSPNFYVTLSALENNSNVEIRSVPKLSTLNGHSAKLSIGSSRYYSQKTQNIVPSLNAQTVVTEQFTEVNANLEINIKPVVSGDDQVTLGIQVNISDFIGNPPLNAPPPKATSMFSSIIRAKNEDMIVLGGLERTESTENGSGVPFLGRIPVLKWLFSSRERNNNKVVTLVFIKPIILY